MKNNITIDIISNDESLKLAYSTAQSAAFDLPAIIKETIILKPGERKKISAGFKMHIRLEEGQLAAAVIAPRSGLGSRGLVISNTIGLIDADYQGDVGICLFNNGVETFTINPNDRIMQMFLIPVLRAQFNFVDEFEEKTERGEGGFGSTGIS